MIERHKESNSPDAERPGRWGEVGLFSMVVVRWTSYRVDVTTREANVERDIDDCGGRLDVDQSGLRSRARGVVAHL